MTWWVHVTRRKAPTRGGERAILVLASRGVRFPTVRRLPAAQICDLRLHPSIGYIHISFTDVTSHLISDMEPGEEGDNVEVSGAMGPDSFLQFRPAL